MVGEYCGKWEGNNLNSLMALVLVWSLHVATAERLITLSTGPITMRWVRPELEPITLKLTDRFSERKDGRRLVVYIWNIFPDILKYNVLSWGCGCTWSLNSQIYCSCGPLSPQQHFSTMDRSCMLSAYLHFGLCQWWLIYLINRSIKIKSIPVFGRWRVGAKDPKQKVFRPRRHWIRSAM